MSTPINRNQALFMRWYEEYRERPYLADAPDDAVMQRARDLISNICTLEQNGTIGSVHPACTGATASTDRTKMISPPIA